MADLNHQIDQSERSGEAELRRFEAELQAQMLAALRERKNVLPETEEERADAARIPDSERQASEAFLHKLRGQMAALAGTKF